MRSLAAVFLTAALAFAQPPASKKPVTLESLGSSMSRMMAAMSGQPVWSPKGGRFAHRQGSIVKIYDLSTKQSTDAFDISSADKDSVQPPAPREFGWENRRVRERSIQWSADGKKILVISKGDVFLWDESTGKLDAIIKTPSVERDPKLSPDGAKVGFRRGHELYVIDVQSKKETRLTHDASATLWNGELDWVYPEELDLGTAWWWSPDSNSIAYLQFDVSREPFYPQSDHLQMAAVAEPQRYPKAGTPNADVRLGVVSATGGLTRWMDLGETREFLLARVHWTPDSSHVITHRLNRIQNRLWILAANASTGQSRLLIEETDPQWININDDFELLSGGRILRSSEQGEGFRHLYLHDAAGKQLARLTRGDWEVSNIACVDEPGQRVFYVSSEESPLERQLWMVSLDGKGRKRVTEGAGSHSINMSPACDAFLDSFSSLESPSRSVLRKSDNTEIAVWREADTKIASEYDIIKTEIHQFKGSDGVLFYARLIKPAGFDPSKKYPAVVQVYGGPHAQSVRNSYAGLSFDQVLAHNGFVVWQMDNRGSFGRGHKFEAAVHRRLGQVEVNDQREGVKYLAGLGFVDPARVGVMGWSYGGYMTLMCLLHAPDVFKAGIAGASVTDWRNYDTIYTERYMGLPHENEEGYKSGSPVNAAANLKGNLLLIHNIQDDNVLFGNALQMMNALQLAGKPFETLIYPQKSHGVSGKAATHMRQQQFDFFLRTLK